VQPKADRLERDDIFKMFFCGLAHSCLLLIDRDAECPQLMPSTGLAHPPIWVKTATRVLQGHNLLTIAPMKSPIADDPIRSLSQLRGAVL
jgi:hypothetical protein